MLLGSRRFHRPCTSLKQPTQFLGARYPGRDGRYDLYIDQKSAPDARGNGKAEIEIET
jgi:hypothetical protein